MHFDINSESDNHADQQESMSQKFTVIVFKINPTNEMKINLAECYLDLYI